MATAFSATHPNLRDFAYSTNFATVARDMSDKLTTQKIMNLIPKGEQQSWIDAFIAFWNIACALEKLEEPDWVAAYEAQKELLMLVPACSVLV